MQTRVDLLHLMAHLDELAGSFVGGWVCIERNNRPWRAQTLRDVTSDTLTTSSGHEYAREDGKSRFDGRDNGRDICLRPLTRERLEYLMVSDALKAAEKMKIGMMRRREWQELVPAAYLILKTAQTLQAVDRVRSAPAEDGADLGTD
ncbi:hypothetical protein E7T09_20305 [Deinococcus sp. KSM4-11]|uniref:hypothetical protein n=1 Tax=Deinococcus sp. KSM4-11 TaxID=2568654 RepID=UPI0010A48E87|nr:hypothetical protein [Deinococcus sp. KSM4-11]THF84353.1 hypothetical protein E7T09_20305 [Deinococcus sp. KSM4-11]